MIPKVAAKLLAHHEHIVRLAERDLAHLRARHAIGAMGSTGNAPPEPLDLTADIAHAETRVAAAKSALATAQHDVKGATP